MTALVAVIIAMTLVVLAFLVAPLVRGARVVADRAEFDRAVYRDQLKELDRDLARGLIGEQEAQSARLEIQRRMLAADSPITTAAISRRQGRSPWLALTLGVLVAIGAAGIYGRLGDPTVPDVPFTSRGVPAQTAAAGGAAAHLDMKDAAEQLERKLQASPKDAEGWLLYARTESMLGDWTKAQDAYQHAIALGQKGADVYAGYGEMVVLAAQGIVSPAARNAFVTARGADPKNDVARFYLALADSQAGEVSNAISAWLALAADIPDDSPMRTEIGRRVAEAAQSGGIAAPTLPKGTAAAPPAEDAPTAGQSGPTEEQMQAAAQMPQAERDRMIGGMIAQLAARLQANPNDLEGWLRLGSAYAVQGKIDAALDAYDHAGRLKPGDPDIKLQAVEALLSRLQPSDPLPPRAISLLQEVAAISPEAPEVLWYLGVVAAREGKPAEARQDWTRLLAGLREGGEDYKMVQSALTELTDH